MKALKTLQIRQLGNRLLNVINKPVFINEQELLTTASIGVSLYPNKAENEQILLHQAITALQNAKSVGGDSVKFFTRGSSNSQALRHLNIEAELDMQLIGKT